MVAPGPVTAAAVAPVDHPKAVTPTASAAAVCPIAVLCDPLALAPDPTAVPTAPEAFAWQLALVSKSELPTLPELQPAIAGLTITNVQNPIARDRNQTK